MRKDSRLITLCLLSSIFILMMAVLSFAASENATGKEQEKSVEVGFPIATVMDSLDISIRQIVSASIVGDGKSVLKAIEPVNGAMDIIYSAVKSGAAKLKKNAEKQEDFNKLEKEFQGRLANIKDAAANNNWELMVRRTAGIINNCARCHQQFKP